MKIEVELAFIAGGLQHLERLCLALRETSSTLRVRDAVLGSGCLLKYPELLDWEKRVGIFGERVSPDTIISSGDRIEIYSALKRDPKTARKERVAEMIKAQAREKSKPKPKKPKLRFSSHP